MSPPDSATARAHWSPRPIETAAAGLGAVVAAALSLGADRPGRLMLLLAALVLVGIVGTDLAVRPRLRADSQGLTVRTPVSHQFLSWSAVDRVRVDEHTRLGLRSRTLEVDAGQTLVVMGRRTLGADPFEVAEVLCRMRPPTPT